MTANRPNHRRQLVDEQTAAATLGIPVQSLRDARSRRVGALAELGWYKIGKRVRYDANELDQFIDSLRRPNTGRNR